MVLHYLLLEVAKVIVDVLPLQSQICDIFTVASSFEDKFGHLEMIQTDIYLAKSSLLLPPSQNIRTCSLLPIMFDCSSYLKNL
jgi:hypothetical protein